MADSIDTTLPAAAPLSEIIAPSAAPTSPDKESPSQDITPEVQDTASSIDTAPPATTPLSEIIAPSAAPISPNEESLSQEGAPEVQDMSVKPASPVLEVHESDKIQEAALASPFSSPKQTGEDSSSEEGEVAENTVDTQAIRENTSEQKSPIIPKDDTNAQVGSGAAGKAPKSLPSLPCLQNSKYVTSPKEISRLTQVARLREVPEGPKSFQQPYDHRMDLNRMKASLEKARSELQAEKNKIYHLRSTIAAELQQKMEAASSVMLANLLRDQGETLALKARVEAKERDLEHRAEKIYHLEVYLAKGRKKLLDTLEEHRGQPWREVQVELAKTQAELDVKKTMADDKAKLATQTEGLRLRQTVQEMREQQYKAGIREVIEAEVSERAVRFDRVDHIARGSYNDGFAAGKEDSRKESAKKNNDIAEDEYNDGFAAGKEAGRKEAFGEAHQKGFLEGYGACHRTQTSLYNMRAGRIPHNSPELDFLFDPAHPHNLHNIGAKIGEFEQKAEEAAATAPKVQDKIPVMNGNGKAPVNNSETHQTSNEKPIANGRVKGHAEYHGSTLSVPEYKPFMPGRANFENKPAGNGRFNSYVDKDPITQGRAIVNVPAVQKPREEQVRQEQIHQEQVRQEQVRQEQVRQEQVRKFSPPKPSFAAELRGASAMHNGHIILANNSASPSAPAKVNGIFGRPIIKYEQEDEVDLIDLMY